VTFSLRFAVKSHFFILVPDGWAFTNNFDINQHQNLQDRLSAAQILVQKEPLCPVVVDDMSDVSAIKYGALPERLYVLQAGKVVYKVRSGAELFTIQLTLYSPISQISPRGLYNPYTYDIPDPEPHTGTDAISRHRIVYRVMCHFPFDAINRVIKRPRCYLHSRSLHSRYRMRRNSKEFSQHSSTWLRARLMLAMPDMSR